MTPAERTAEIDRLQLMLVASKASGGGYKERIAAIEAQLKILRTV